MRDFSDQEIRVPIGNWTVSLSTTGLGATEKWPKPTKRRL
jgi:hypothetical protein